MGFEKLVNLAIRTLQARSLGNDGVDVKAVYKAKRLVNIAVFGTKSMNLFGAVWPVDDANVDVDVDADVIFWFSWFMFWWLVDIMSEEESKR